MNPLLILLYYMHGPLHGEAGVVSMPTERLELSSSSMAVRIDVEQPLGPLRIRLGELSEHHAHGDAVDVSLHAGLMLGPVFAGWQATDLEVADGDGGPRHWAAVSMATSF